jgi:hypothetical protein
MVDRQPSFWFWFHYGNGGKPGWRHLVSESSIIDIFIGLLLGVFLTVDLSDASKTILFPVASIFVGVAVAWASNSQSILLSDEVQELAQRNKGGFPEYIYPFQLGTSIMIMSIIIWALIGLKIDIYWIPQEDYELLRKIIGFCCFFILSLSIRTCWQIVNLAVTLMIYAKTLNKNHSNPE